MPVLVVRGVVRLGAAAGRAVEGADAAHAGLAGAQGAWTAGRGLE